MILPSKHISQERSMLTVGARILQHLSQSKTISAIWEELLPNTTDHTDVSPLRYDGFVLALDLLYLVGAVELKDGILSRRTP